ncbi:MAG: 3'-5' exoribonuclease [Actinobacteria bacterium]|nr:3'-5' exoribonuclease [Actinomycetota bacterium]
MSDAVVFLDTETTGKGSCRRPWEIAIIRRDVTGDREITLYVDVADLDLPHADPEALAISRFQQRHPQRDGVLNVPNAHLVPASTAAAVVQRWTVGARVFGVVPSFDTSCLEALLERHDRAPLWHYQPWDIAVLATGYLIARQIPVQRSAEATSLACGVAAPTPNERHTALGDARWVRRLYDRLFAEATYPQSCTAA